jgi:glycosyltransferase involved in cell wall biosynthesis
VTIVMACHYYPPHIGGIEVVAQAQAASTAARGRPVVVLTSTAGGGRGGDATPDGVTLVRLPAWNGLEDLIGIPFPLFGLRFLIAAWRAIGKAEVVHVHDVFYLSSQLAGLVALVRRKPLFITQHVALVDHPSRTVMALQRLIYATSGSLLFRRARHVVVYNANVRETVRQYGGETPVLEVRNGIDTDMFSPCDAAEKRRLRQLHGLPLERPIALFVGRLVAKKGYEELFRARSRDYLTVFVGGGRPAPGVTSDDDARLIGAVDRASLVDHYRMSDVFVLPAVGELFTLSMQEAMACALPVVTTDEPRYAEYEFDRAAITLTDRTPEALRATITSLLGDGERLAAAARYSREFAVREFSWDANIDRVLALYDAT